MVNINCDIGEGLNNEHLLLPFISSCNIACGAHAGSVKIIDKVIGLAIENKVKIGVHPSFPDRENFGRKVLDISNEALQQSLEEQMELLKERTSLQKANLYHVKPHGALYNLIAINKEKAVVVVKAIQNVFKEIKLYVPYNSEIERVARNRGIEIVYEAFADRNYNDDLTLVSRVQSDAILTDPKVILSHITRMANTSRVLTLTGTEKEIKAETFCLHGDNKNVIEILKYLNKKLIVE